jgi:crotonobetainyl-CoA:carnitine CoA-transferase CaiB-like acyl-CoA transferase
MISARPRPGALSHLRICDLSGQLAGAGATRFLAAFGAEVIRVEDPVRQGRWDILRGSAPLKDERRGVDFGGAFNNHNVEKLGVTLNLRDERGKALLRELIAQSDAVTENFAAGVMERLGFGYAALKAIRPDILYVSNCGFGHTGPYARYKTFGPIVQACSGLTFASGLAGREPAGIGYSYMDHMGADVMALAILAGLIHRAKTGQGQWIDMACTEGGLALAGPDLLDYTVNGRPLRREGRPDSNRSFDPPMAPHGIYPCAGQDLWVAIACRDDADWRRLGAAIDEPWVDEPRWAAIEGRKAGEDELDGLVAAWTAGREREAVVEDLLARGVPAALVALPQDRIEHDADTAAWGLWPTTHHSAMGELRVDGIPAHFSRTDWSIARGAPCLGEHNRQVFGGLLGLSDAEIDNLSADGVI